MNGTRITQKRSSHLTLWIGSVGAIVVIIGWILFGYAQGQKKENEKKNHSKAVPSDAELRSRLTKDQYRVVREGDTETPFQNAYWDNQKTGIYVDIITGEPLFSSLDKFDSGTGSPSFTKPISKGRMWKKGILPTEWSALKFAQAKVIRTSVTCSPMVRRQLVNATLSIRPRCVSFRWRN